MALESKDILEQSLRDFHLLSPDMQARLMDDFLEEQPYLTGFLYNLTEDFGEHQLEALMSASLALGKSFLQAGLVLARVEQEVLTAVIEDKVAAYEVLAQSEMPIEFPALLELSSSPLVTAGLLEYILNRSGEDELDPDLVLVVDIVISAMEQSVAPITKGDEN